MNANDFYKSPPLSWYRAPFGILYSNNVYALMQECNSFWIIDVIGLLQNLERVKIEEFQIWKIYKNKDSEFDVMLYNQHGKNMASFLVKDVGFNYSSCVLWLVKNRLIFPAEY